LPQAGAVKTLLIVTILPYASEPDGPLHHARHVFGVCLFHFAIRSARIAILAVQFVEEPVLFGKSVL